MVFNVNFHNISAISWRSALLVEGNRSTRRKPDPSQIRIITKLPYTKQSSNGKGKPHMSTNRHNQLTTEKLGKSQWLWLGTGISKELVGWIRSHTVVLSTLRHERDSNSQLQWWYVLIVYVVVYPTTLRLRPRRPQKGKQNCKENIKIELKIINQ